MAVSETTKEMPATKKFFVLAGKTNESANLCFSLVTEKQV